MMIRLDEFEPGKFRYVRKRRAYRNGPWNIAYSQPFASRKAARMAKASGEIQWEFVNRSVGGY